MRSLRRPSTRSNNFMGRNDTAGVRKHQFKRYRNSLAPIGLGGPGGGVASRTSTKYALNAAPCGAPLCFYSPQPCAADVCSHFTPQCVALCLTLAWPFATVCVLRRVPAPPLSPDIKLSATYPADCGAAQLHSGCKWLEKLLHREPLARAADSLRCLQTFQDQSICRSK